MGENVLLLLYIIRKYELLNMIVASCSAERGVTARGAEFDCDTCEKDN